MRAPKYCTHRDSDGPCLNLVPAGTRNCDQHASRWGKTAASQRTATSDWRKRRAIILKRDNFRCYVCGGPANQVDHIVAVAHGGSDKYDNLAAICPPCHQRKSLAEARDSRLK